MIPKAPAAIRAATAILALAIAASALVGLWLGVFAVGQLIPGVVGFEALILLAGVFGLLFGLGKFSHGFGIGLLCIGGTVAVAAGLSFLDARANITGPIAGWLKPLLFGRAAGGAALAALAGAAVLVRSPDSMRKFFQGGALGLIPAAALTVGHLFRGVLLSPAPGGLEAVRIIGLLIGALVVAVLISVSLGMMITAFQIGPSGVEDARKAPGRRSVKAAS